MAIKIAVIGDIHKSWNEKDIEFFNGSDYDLVLIVGDLPGRSHSGLLDIAQGLSRLEKKALYIPGNHDGVSVMQLIAELQQNEKMIERTSRKQDRKCDELREALGSVEMCGYSLHTVSAGGRDIDVIAARPHSMGGPDIGFRPYLKRKFNVGDLTESGEKLKALVDQAKHPILFLAHNGPTGLGEEKHSIWGCDFKKEAGDFGDIDLREALEHAAGKNHPVLGVVAGHMHHALRNRKRRTWYLEDGGLAFVNAARVPRIFKNKGRLFHHHIELEIDDGITTREVLVQGDQVHRTPALEALEQPTEERIA